MRRSGLPAVVFMCCVITSRIYNDKTLGHQAVTSVLQQVATGHAGCRWFAPR